MAATAMKHMALNFAKLDKFEGVDFKRWQKKMNFLLSSMSVVYLLTTLIPEDGDDASVEQLRKRNKWENDDYVCRGSILKVMEQYNELLGILGRFTQHKMNMDEAIQISCIIDKLPPYWKDFKHTLKHKKEELTLVELGNHQRIEESLRAQDSDKPKGNNVVGPQLNIVNDNIASAFMSTSKLNDSILWHPRLDHVHFKRMQDMSKDGLIPAFDMDIEKSVVRLLDPKLKTLGERGIECIFVRYVEHSKAFRFYVIKPNESVLINSIIESRDAIFDENRFSSVPRPSLGIPNGTEDIGGSVVPEEATEEDDPKTFDEAMKSQDVVFWKEAINDEMDSIIGNNTWVLADLPPSCKPLGCKWIFKRKLKVDGTVEKFKARLVIQGFKQKSGIYYFDTYAPVARISTIRLLIAMTSIHNLIIHQIDAPKQWHQKFDEVVLSNGYLLNQADKCVYSKFDESGKGVIICLYVDDMLIFGTDQVQVDLTKKFLSSRFSMKDMGEADVILGIRIKHESNGIAISQSHYIEKYSRVIGCLMYAMTCTRPDIAFAVGKLSRYTSNPVLEGYTDASWTSNTEDNSSTSGWVFLLGGGAISWASKKQTCITGSTMESEFMALAAAGKEAEWLKNLLLEIPLWVKPIAPISIHCDSAATLAKAYSQMYNGKSRHLGVRHSMIRELITNGMVSIEFVRTEAHVLQIIPRMCLEPAEKENEVVNFLMVNFFEKVLSRSMNKEEPPILPSGQWTEAHVLQSSQGCA
ncbi:zinc finger, CCHC-type containing protein [Tanacetum coccineum]